MNNTENENNEEEVKLTPRELELNKRLDEIKLKFEKDKEFYSNFIESN